ncbi:hypothetical protein COOONC_06126 [Cooperia oncophora]
MTNMACTFYREIPSFELRFACNFKGCLDDRPMSMMGAIEHQAFHFCEVYKTQAHFNFKCEYCNVYHVNKSHHRLCLDDKTGIGHLPHLRSIYTVPMTDPEFHSCVDFSRFANHHMIAVTAEGVRLVPCDLDTSLPGPGIDDNSSYGRKSSSVSYRDLDNCDENSNSEKFGRPGGFQDRNQSGNREFRGRGRGGPRGRGERGFGRGRGRGGGHRDDDNGRENSFRGRGRGRGADHRGDTNNSYRSRDSFGNKTTRLPSSQSRKETVRTHVRVVVARVRHWPRKRTLVRSLVKTHALVRTLAQEVTVRFRLLQRSQPMVITRFFVKKTVTTQKETKPIISILVHIHEQATALKFMKLEQMKSMNRRKVGVTAHTLVRGAEAPFWQLLQRIPHQEVDQQGHTREAEAAVVLLQGMTSTIIVQQY